MNLTANNVMIDYGRIQRALDFWQRRGYVRIETPWTVTRKIADLTKPKEVTREQFDLKHEDGKTLVASGEQGFLYQYSKGYLPPGRFVTVTPCFRPEPHDATHQKTFMKVELICTEPMALEKTMFRMLAEKRALVKIESQSGRISIEDLDHRYRDLHDLHDRLDRGDIFNDVVDVTTRPTGVMSWDIELNGIEIGSYGVRTCPFLQWSYGTGLAEPRFGRALMAGRK